MTLSLGMVLVVLVLFLHDCDQLGTNPLWSMISALAQFECRQDRLLFERGPAATFLDGRLYVCLRDVRWPATGPPPVVANRTQNHPAVFSAVVWIEDGRFFWHSLLGMVLLFWILWRQVWR